MLDDLSLLNPDSPEVARYDLRTGLDGLPLARYHRRFPREARGAKRSWFIYGAYRAVDELENKPSWVSKEKGTEHEVTFHLGGSLIEQAKPDRVFEDVGYHKNKSERPNFTLKYGLGKFKLATKDEPEKSKPVTKRGRIFSYSEASRWRFQQLMGRFQRDQLAKGLFVTLTYPAQYPTPQEAKKQMRAFIKRILRRWPQACVIWRLEFQTRGAPHFHLLVLGIPFIPHQLVARWWYEIVGSENPDHLKAGTEVRAVRTAREAIWYITKYMAKAEQSIGPENEDMSVGRYWGVEGNDALYKAAAVNVTLYGYQVVQLGRFMRHLVNSHRRKNGKSGPGYQDHVLGRNRRWLCDAEQVFDDLHAIVEARHG